MENLIKKLSNRCGLESCRFWNSGTCTDQQQRAFCIETLIAVIPDQADRAQIVSLEPTYIHEIVN